MIFIAINLDDFHSNQHGEARTTAEMRLIDACGLVEAQKWIDLNYPEHPWALVAKSVFDKNIVCRCTNKDNC